MKQNHHRPEWKEVFQQAPVPDQKDAIMDQLRFIEPLNSVFAVTPGNLLRSGK